MRKTRRTTADLANIVKEAKKQKLAHHAQRKFASTYPSSPSQKEPTQSTKQGFPKSEDFIEFLCVRHAPFLSSDLEVFAEPLVMSQSVSDDDIFHNEDIKDSPQSVQTCLEEKLQANSLLLFPKVILEKQKVLQVEYDTASDLTNESDITEKNHKDEPLEMSTVNQCTVNLTEMKNFTQLLSNLSETHKSIILISPPNDWIALQYIQDDLKFNVKTKHIHRLKHPLCENFLTLLCIKRQLECESHTKFNEVPQMGLCEMDLTQLFETVNMFGGLEAVNSDQNWKLIADHLKIPKAAARRVSKLEDLYLKFILPYDRLSEDEKIKLRAKIKNDLTSTFSLPYERIITRKISLETFHRMACNSASTYWKQNSTVEETEIGFWELVDNGIKHIAAVSGQIDLYTNPQSYQRSKKKPLWSLQDLYNISGSAFKYLGKVKELSVPVLLFEGVFSTSEWCIEEHGFHTISYMHSGAEKIWYIIPEKYTSLFLNMQNGKQSLLSPNDVLEKSCHVIRCVQKEGDYVVIQPGCYYCTISSGYSCSEIVCFAPLEWFLSSYFNSYQPKLNDFLFTKMLLNMAIGEAKNTTRSVYSECLSEKLIEVRALLSKNLKRLHDNGIKTTCSVKTKTSVFRQCSVCCQTCYLIAITSKNNDDSVMCVNDVMNHVTKKRFDGTELIIECVITVNTIDSLLKKLKQ